MNNSEMKIRVTDLNEGDTLAKDLYVERRLLMKKGSQLSSRIITLLKNRNVDFVYINNERQQNEKEKHRTNNENQQFSKENKQINNLDITQLQLTTENLSEQFFSTLAELSVEKRYGHALKNMDDIEFVKNLFIQLMSVEKYRKQINDLKKWDTFSYYHSIDVFVLTTLFAKQEGIANIENMAIGFLLHDIGKLYIPLSVLRKKGKLTNDEYQLIQTHTIEGHKTFCSLGLNSIAYLASSHHENHNGSGYPEGLTGSQMPKELEILHLIDAYSAITMTRSYRQAIGAADALTIIFRDEQNYNPDILSRFVDFIGIYPENAIVRLTDKSYALIKQVNEQYPLLPLVQKLNNNQLIQLPIDYQLSIEKMIQYRKETVPQLLNTFYEDLINENIEGMEKTYSKLTDSIPENEQFKQLFIPTLQILNILFKENKMSETRYKKIIKFVTQLLNTKLINLQEQYQPNRSIIFLTEREYQHHYVLKLFQGLFFSQNFFPFLVDATTSETEITNIITYCNAHSVFVIRDQFEPVLTTKQDTGIYYLSPTQLEQFIFGVWADSSLDLRSSLEKYKVIQNTISIS